MQAESEGHSDFSERTEVLSYRFGVTLSELPDIIGISRAMFHAYRSGKNPISPKAWRKLGAAEAKANSIAGHHIGPAYPGALLEESDSEMRSIPVIGWAHAGSAGNYEEIPQGSRDMIPSNCRDRKAFAVRLEGDSMEPEFHEGDILILQPGEEAYSGCLAVIKLTNDGIIFRRIEFRKGHLRLIPLNPQYTMEEIPKEDIAWIYPVWGRWTQIWKR